MTKAPSLALRIVGFLIVAQIFAFAIGWIATFTLGAYGLGYMVYSFDALAASRTKDMIVMSLTRGEDRRLRIEPNAELRAEIARAPLMRYAAFEAMTGRAVEGSAPELVPLLAKIVDLSTTHAHFNLPEDPKTEELGFMAVTRTPFGQMHIATYRQKFRFDDFYYSMRDEFAWLNAYIVAVVLISAATAWFAVRQGLRPLASVAAGAARIDMDSLHQRLPLRGVPAEILTLVDSMNGALARLDAGAARMRRYTANAAHELRTPLAILRARLEDKEDPTFKSDLMRDASQLQAIVEQLLAAARLGERQGPVDEWVDLVDAIRRIVADYMPLVIECGREIAFEGGPTPVVARGNRRAIECIVANLIDNALRAEPRGGTVLVTVGDARIEVIDHGEGVAPADRETIFEPFWRKSEATPGTGLGLAVARELMEKMGGRIAVLQTPGGGATFRLSFARGDLG
ncbi:MULTISPECIES: sensor histidine kinase [Methylosinus]|uniref:histidine kinase n=1 Tax=Methylosinus trichosporium (strain ATCC 35070 / NCIMB 11131 / UNIQEM 75 / OB3b) TaxID=595536 RepID=A0A2D2CX03_METT3|nr:MULTISPECIES: HAMP domain-containing sensor histidine kinase [Methylosinus]ATQ67206.1 sensor histidine kinase [Methylosinus trichosporium OB3b]OBS52222.1 two-component sensor histidine kinase [Methylosinus sp. 3S-1]